MPNYPVIPIVQYYDNAVEHDPRAAKVELGKGGVLDRSRIHFFNNTRKSYSISAVLKDRDTLQNFLELNRGKPFEFRYDGANSAGLFICKTWSWDWVVYVDGVSGVWNFSATFEQVFRPGWVSESNGSGTLTLPIISLVGSGSIISNPIANGNLLFPLLSISGQGEISQSATGSGNLITPLLEVSGVGNIINVGQGNFILSDLTTTGVGNVPHIAVGTLETPALTLEGTGILYILHEGSGDLLTPDMSVSGSGSLPITGSGSLETSAIVVSGSGTMIPNLSNQILKINPGGSNGDTTYTSDDGFNRSITFTGASITSTQFVTNSTSISFPTNTSRISFAGDSNIFVSGTPLTLDLDLRFSSPDSLTGGRQLFQVAVSSTHLFYLRFEYYGTTFEPLVDFLNEGGTFQRYKRPSSFSNSVIGQNTWRRIRIVIPSASINTGPGSIYFYIDGVYYGLQRDSFTPGPSPTQIRSGTGGLSSTISFGPGIDASGNRWTGFMDNISWYNEALSGPSNYTP